MFLLACGSLGLIGLSRFLLCSVSFFCPNPFQRLRSCSFRYTPFTPPRIINPSKRSHSFTPFRKHFITFFHSRPCFSCKKTSLHAKNRASPACSTLAATALIPLCFIAGYLCLPPSLHSQSARLLMQQPKNALHSATLHCAAFLVLRSGLFYLRCFVATPTPTPTTHP